MSKKIILNGFGIIKCTNPKCQVSFSVIAFAFADKTCTQINEARIIPLTGNTPYYCPTCGKNLGKK
jgi:hypothetical protein